MFKNSSENRVPVRKDKFHTIAEVRDYDQAAPRNTLLYPMQRLKELIKPYMKEGKTIVNLGCETGILVLMSSGENGVHITGFDEEPLLIKGAEENLRLAKLCSYPGDATFTYAELTNLPLASHTVDVVFADNFLYKTEKIAEVLKECRRIVKDTGVIIMNQLIRDADKEKIQFLRQYLKNDVFGGEEEFIETLNSCYSYVEYVKVLQENKELGYEIRKEQMSVIISYNAEKINDWI